MKKIISSAALAAASLALATPAAHAAPAPAADAPVASSAVATAQEVLAGFTAALPDPPKSEVDLVGKTVFGLLPK